jgi:hypothetical protein
MNTLSKTIPLETPIKRGETTIEKVELRKPSSGELRGTSLLNLINMDVASLEIVLPRITTPPLLKSEVATLDPPDLFSFAQEVAGFLLTRQQKENFQIA